MPKDSQIDPKDVRLKKSRGGPSIADEEVKNHSRTSKKQSANGDKPGNDR